MKIIGWTNGRSFYFGEERPGEGTKKAEEWRPLAYADESISQLEFPLFQALMEAGTPGLTGRLPDILDQIHDEFLGNFSLTGDRVRLIIRRISEIMKSADAIIKEWEAGKIDDEYDRSG